MQEDSTGKHHLPVTEVRLTGVERTFPNRAAKTVKVEYRIVWRPKMKEKKWKRNVVDPAILQTFYTMLWIPCVVPSTLQDIEIVRCRISAESCIQDRYVTEVVSEAEEYITENKRETGARCGPAHVHTYIKFGKDILSIAYPTRASLLKYPDNNLLCAWLLGCNWTTFVGKNIPNYR